MREKILVLGLLIWRLCQNPHCQIFRSNHTNVQACYTCYLFWTRQKQKNAESEHVIISVEMNDKHYKLHATTISNLGQLLAEAKLVFPNSKNLHATN